MLTQKQVEEARKQLGININNPATPTGSTLLERLEGKKEPTFGGKIIRETVRPLAKLATSGINLAQNITGNEETQPFSGEYLGEVKKVGDGLNPLGIDEEGNKTGERIFSKNNVNALKDSVKTGVDIGVLTAGAGATKNIAKTGIKEGIKQGAKVGAKTGSIVGGTSGLATGLEEDATLGSTLKNTAIGAVGGAVVGGTVGGVSGGVSNVVKATKKIPETLKSATNKVTGKPKTEDDFALSLVSPKATEKIKQEALAQGRVSEQGLLRPSKILPSKRDIKLAKSVKGIVSMKKSPIQNVDSLSSAISKINNKVKSYVKANKVPFNTNQLKTQLNKGKGELKVIFASDKQAEKTYDAVVKEFVKHVKKKDTAGLLDARQAFDKIPAIRKLLESQGLGENVKKEIVLTARLKANEYVASLLPKGNKYRADLLKESHMLEVIGNIADKNTKEIGLNKLQALTLKYPILKYWTSLLIGAGGVGVGSVIIGSSD